MTPDALRTLLAKVSQGALPVDQAMEQLKELPFGDLGVAKVDHHRALRCGFPEVVYGPGKRCEDLVTICTAIVSRDHDLLVTRVDADQARAVATAIPDVTHDEISRTLTRLSSKRPEAPPRPVLVVCAGTTDLPVAEEARVTAEMLGSKAEVLGDVGVAGIHRLLAHGGKLREAGVIVVVAGMEGALPSVVGGLVDVPVIAVPTSVGYGANFGGISALLGMLNSCAPGLTVVNIDNGFGAGYAAAVINRQSLRRVPASD